MCKSVQCDADIRMLKSVGTLDDAQGTLPELPRFVRIPQLGIGVCKA